MSRLIESLVPSRLGTSFRWLLGSAWTSNLGDGIAMAAGPLLVASQTDDARLVALAALLQRLPWLLLALWAGAVADRVDRRLLVVAGNLARAAVLLVLCTTIATGEVSVAVVLLTMLALGVAEVFTDTTASTLTPMLVEKADLGTASTRMQAGFLTVNQLAGPPVGAFLFAAGMAWPFVTQLVTMVLAAMLVSRISIPRGSVRPDTDSHVRQDIVEGLRWVRDHAAIRTLALVILTFNITWAAPWGVMVLWALDRVHMSEVGFGLLTTASAVGGVLGTVSYGWLERRFDLATLMKGCLLLEVLMHLVLALTTVQWLAFVTMFGFGAYAFVWFNVSQVVRQRAVPTEFQGRVASVYLMAVFGGMAIGQALGGFIAEHWGLAAPWWFAFVGSGITLALVWTRLAHIAHPDEAPAEVT
ncbi:MFS transporter [Nocardioides seonyuensis]|uniref:MFS transporter n=1 Tax=Nocardioides seonyuensis TaxID=2518371 RepID=A0A4P7IDZ2_9ACTN|nr:MFS transporter [Nocardioides seonyuensis]QBX54187.1 MFS transporter [Nocardioides seonyuensis]